MHELCRGNIRRIFGPKFLYPMPGWFVLRVCWPCFSYWDLRCGPIFGGFGRSMFKLSGRGVLRDSGSRRGDRLLRIWPILGGYGDLVHALFSRVLPSDQRPI